VSYRSLEGDLQPSRITADPSIAPGPLGSENRRLAMCESSKLYCTRGRRPGIQGTVFYPLRLSMQASLASESALREFPIHSSLYTGRGERYVPNSPVPGSGHGELFARREPGLGQD
jgi:hypothetical protein